MNKVRELAEKLMLTRTTEFEHAIRAALEPLLEKAEALAHYDGSRSCDNCVLGAELEGWRAGQEEAG